MTFPLTDFLIAMMRGDPIDDLRDIARRYRLNGEWCRWYLEQWKGR